MDEYVSLINSTKTTLYVTPILFAAHAPSVITWTIAVRRKTCAEALETALEMKNDENIGMVEATPVLEFSEKEPITENLKIIIDDLFPTFSCAELDADKYEKNETAPLNSLVPKSKIEPN